MNHDLYFVSILARALQGPDPRESLKNAFEMIERRGQEPGYQEGYRNFCRFMAEVGMHHRMWDEHDLRMAALELFAGTPSEAERWKTPLAKLAERAPWLKDECEALSQACGPRPRAFNLQLFREGRQIAELTFETARGSRLVNVICLGCYALRLDMGLVLWEEVLTAADLLWTEAFGGKELVLAAEDGEVRRQPSREVKVPDAGLILRIFPGIESGSLEIELTP